MSLSKLKSGNSDPFENGGRPSGPPAVQISCRVCHGVFFDNDSLVRHFECHTEEELRIYHKDLASLLRGYKSSLSALATMNEDHSAFSSLNDCFRPRSLPANKKPTDRNRYYIPMMNFTPSVSPSSNPQLNVSQPGRNSRRRVMRQYGVNSSFSCPSMASLLDAIKSASGSRATPQFQLREQNGGQTDLPHYQNPSISELGMPNKEKIILSDEEED